jgi:hypothetical protein
LETFSTSLTLSNVSKGKTRLCLGGGTERPAKSSSASPTRYLSDDAPALGAGVVFLWVAGCRRSPPCVAAGFVGVEGASFPFPGLASW